MRPFRLGLTGGLASGKSTVARLLADHGAEVIDADRLVAELYQPGEPGAAAVAQLFGGDFLDTAGAVDKPRLAQKLWSDPTARQALEGAIHPLVRERFAAVVAQSTADLVVLEATLLVEAGYAPDFDLVVTVEAPREQRRERAIERGLSPAEADARLTAQGDGATRRAGAGWVIENTGSREELARAVSDLVAAIRGGLGPPRGEHLSP